MIPIAMLLSVALAGLTQVRALSIQPVEDRTEVVIEVDGAVTLRDFLLRDPVRLVLDLTGADLAASRQFEGIGRGGVIAIRASRFQPGVVRVVLELTESVNYSVEQSAGAVRVAFRNPAGPFEPWRVDLSGDLAMKAARPGAAPAPAAATPPAAGTAPAAQRRITVYFQETPIQDVLATFAEFAGKSVVTGPDLKGNVTADIRDQPWDVALDAILGSRGLTARELESGIIRVDEVTKLREAEKVETLVTREFPIKYVSADSLVQTVTGILKTDSASSVVKNSSSNSLLVTARESVMRERIEPIINQLDVRVPQVTIAAKIIFVDRSAIEELGFVYDIKDSRGTQLNTVVSGFQDLDGDGVLEENERTTENVVLLGGESVAALANATARVGNPTLQVVSTLVLGRHSLISFLEAIQDLRLSNTQASPVITTLDHREARVQVGADVPIRVVEAQAGAGGQAGFPRAQTETRQTGVILAVTPHVTGNQVLLEIRAERSFPVLAGSDVGFVFNTQETETQVLVNDGETVVISGLTVIEKSEARTGIPILMDLPLVGALFRTTRQQETKQDLLIMVTPHIIRESGQ